MDDDYDVEPPYATDGWHSLDSARANWYTGAPAEDWVLQSLLDAAKDACIAYAPGLADDAEVPSSYRLAQIMQARNILNASKSDPATSADGDLFVIRPYPMDNFIKQILRPRRAVPVLS